ncbi:hypothetical protein GCM10010840_14750 [Deinococcus aerolatus]|uniref:Uncharacterized protein n=1 Tax=Deinococcus aerolatus TaxID=522487 RepID=A0ABQ2G703_9DEIO|nr:hypothetical protein [Deinococcus aerolatus]GGL77906.1 hypothetical protein GCM10010840_14750 [Deinococcus aerolatus]
MKVAAPVWNSPAKFVGFLFQAALDFRLVLDGLEAHASSIQLHVRKIPSRQGAGAMSSILWRPVVMFVGQLSEPKRRGAAAAMLKVLMTRTEKKKTGVGRAKSFAKGQAGDASHAQALTDLGYPARPRPQAAGLGRVREAEARRLMAAYGITHDAALELMRASGTLPQVPTDIESTLLAPVAHLESKFYRECQVSRAAVMAQWRTQVHADAKPHQIPVVLHSWDYSREPWVLVFPRDPRQGWTMQLLSEWIHGLERTGYIVRNADGTPALDPATGKAKRAYLRPAAGAGTPLKAQAMLSVSPAARLDAARWARTAGGDYAAGERRAAQLRSEWTDWVRAPEGQRAWLDFCRAHSPFDDRLDALAGFAVDGRRYTLQSLRPVILWERGGLNLQMIVAKDARADGRSPEGARDYRRARPVRIVDDCVYDLEDLVIEPDDQGQPRRDPGGELVWRLSDGALPLALAAAEDWSAS